VVNLASVSSFIAQPEMFIYNSSKGAVAQLTRCLALDFALENIRVNAVCPGTIRTPAVDRHIAAINLPLEDGLALFAKDSPMDRLGDPSEVSGCNFFFS
jgi:NAD(P)-dependent dehydrogenase (short-subunit alcohol dehydrogenase family)